MEDSWDMIIDPASQLGALAVSSHLVVDQHHLRQEMNGNDKTPSWELANVFLNASVCLSCGDDDDDDDDDDDCDIYKNNVYLCCWSLHLVFLGPRSHNEFSLFHPLNAARA